MSHLARTARLLGVQALAAVLLAAGAPSAAQAQAAQPAARTAGAWIGGLAGSALTGALAATLTGCLGSLDSPHCWPAVGGTSTVGAAMGTYLGNGSRGPLGYMLLGSLVGTAGAALIATRVDPDHGGAYIVLGVMPVLQTAGAVVASRSSRR
jgi:hypothetical protein